MYAAALLATVPFQADRPDCKLAVFFAKGKPRSESTHNDINVLQANMERRYDSLVATCNVHISITNAATATDFIDVHTVNTSRLHVASW